MKHDPNDLTTKRRILDSAAQVFAEYSYDGARVDEIAKRAGVNKALIYYYYKSKEELLALLFQETRDAVFALFSTKEFQAIDYTSIESVSGMTYAILDVLEEKQNIIRIMLMEIAKRTPINDRIFTFIEEVINAMFEMAETEQLAIEQDKSKAMVTEFFTGIMPLLDYVAYHEIWMDRYSIDETTLRKQFVSSFLGTHFAYTIKDFPHEHSYNPATDY